MQFATKQQITKIHVLLANTGFMDSKADIIYGLTDGRTESTKELTIDEARRLITSLANCDPKERQKRLVFSLAYQAGIIYGETSDDKKINAAKLNLFLKERGAIKKELNQMTLDELVKTHRQFEAIVRNNTKAGDKKAANKLVNNLLGELDIKVL
ncbi:hypothetical protein IDJ75_10605 [Mucilaginibacter rigui]|uniref:TerB family tellurite resistance protein n=1 Tax=Mucilaginibacter rigui TaxID=534635 RepID=A0ABR7X569_9SPHI|nr:hypothetical protein [Mucilaginibacter rigui]MBD1385729.1 hypothetical protein [Mucilaginibacter rigui]